MCNAPSVFLPQGMLIDVEAESQTYKHGDDRCGGEDWGRLQDEDN